MDRTNKLSALSTPKKAIVSNITGKKKISNRKTVVPNENTVEAKVEAKVSDIIKFKDLEGALLLVNVGDNDRPASDQDLTDISDTLSALLEDNHINCVAYVTNHTVNIKVIK